MRTLDQRVSAWEGRLWRALAARGVDVAQGRNLAGRAVPWLPSMQTTLAALAARVVLSAKARDPLSLRLPGTLPVDPRRWPEGVSPRYVRLARRAFRGGVRLSVAELRRAAWRSVLAPGDPLATRWPWAPPGSPDEPIPY